ncbi:SirB1 family protein [Calycomorphotria hydatis]|uniref:Protein SirB1 N-terminal domain-containing protein n=1 Tax=Calycomorphotria hydatis TaxID=2528027 RepID=A0A517T844_9PLAN|nr:transglutaminase-like domain-containing protein [Calycomorphotria hydatis]QDT64541.1 hypothetical protein V22_17760 [Calycomorphotria hydatis]
MSLQAHEYPCDTEFLKLIARCSEVDLVTAALELARDIDPSLCFRSCHEWIDTQARELRREIARADSEHDALVMLGKHLSSRCHLTGDPAAYRSAEGSCLHRVIDTGRGIPISLSVIYMAVAARVGIELHGVAAPLHFLTRYDGVSGVFFIDAFDGGRVMAEADCHVWLSAKTGMSVPELERVLLPASHRTIVIRMLNNLKMLYIEQEDWNAAWQVQHRLTTLQPTSYAEQRDLALLTLRAQRPGQAIDLLKSCLQSCPKEDRETLSKNLKQAMSAVCQLN